MMSSSKGYHELQIQDIDILKCSKCNHDYFREEKTGRVQPGRATFELKYSMVDIKYKYYCLKCGEELTSEPAKDF